MHSVAARSKRARRCRWALSQRLSYFLGMLAVSALCSSKFRTSSEDGFILATCSQSFFLLRPEAVSEEVFVPMKGEGMSVTIGEHGFKM